MDTCPKCGRPELNADTQLLNWRGNKVHTRGQWWSRCLACEIDDHANINGRQLWFGEDRTYSWQ